MEISQLLCSRHLTFATKEGAEHELDVAAVVRVTVTASVTLSLVDLKTVAGGAMNLLAGPRLTVIQPERCWRGQRSAIAPSPCTRTAAQA